MPDVGKSTGFDAVFGSDRGNGRSAHEQRAVQANLEPAELTVLQALAGGQAASVVELRELTSLPDKDIKDSLANLQRRGLATADGVTTEGESMVERLKSDV